jgi:hypothetical protein
MEYKLLVCPVLENGTACWNPYRECQINALDRVQNNAAKCTHHRERLDTESLAPRRKLLRMCALYKAYTGERAWKTIGNRLQTPSYLSRFYHN